MEFIGHKQEKRAVLTTVASRETASYCERNIVNDKTELFMSQKSEKCAL